MGIIPATSLGALLTTWSPRWSARLLLRRFLASGSMVPRAMFDRLLPAMSATLLSVSTIHLLWRLLHLPDLPPWQLLLLLLIAVFAAIYTSQTKVSALIIKHTRRMIALLTSKVALASAGLLGGLLGGGLVFGFPWNWLTIPGILVGAGIIIGLERYVESQMRPPPPPATK
jgi:hypothetical protein